MVRNRGDLTLPWPVRLSKRVFDNMARHVDGPSAFLFCVLCPFVLSLSLQVFEQAAFSPSSVS